MIEQQLYTRSSKGYFLQSAGYDTVRFSVGLSTGDAQNYNELYTYNGADVKGASGKLDVVTRMTLADGNVMLCGTKPYDYMSYDGIKHVHIAHAYIMKKDSPELAAQALDIRKLAGVTQFISSHVDGSNEPLDQLAELPFEDKYAQTEYITLINSQYDGSFFAQIVHAVMNSVFNGKKVYLVAKKIEDTYESLDILKAIYYFIPYCLRNQIGYTTLLNNQGLPANISIAFISSGNLPDAERGNLFGSIINRDYCFDLTSQRVLFDGEGTLDTPSDYIQLVKQFYASPETFGSILDIINEQAQLKPDAMASFEQVAKLFVVGDPDTLPLAASVYFDIQKLFGTAQPVLPYMRGLIASAAAAKGGDLNLEELPCVCDIYDSATEAEKDALIELILNSIAYSVSNGNKEEFLAKLLICGDHFEIGGVVNSRFINKDSRAIALYFGEQFAKHGTVRDLMAEVSYIEKNQPYLDDGLNTNPDFIEAVVNRLNGLYAVNGSIALLTEIIQSISNLRTPELKSAINDFAVRQVNTLTAGGEASAYSIDVYDLSRLLDTFDSVITNEDFRNTATGLVNLYNRGDALPADQLYRCFKTSTDANANRLNDYFRQHFEQHPLKNNFLAYSIAYFDQYTGYINLKLAFSRITSLAVICDYANWLARSLRYFRSDNPLPTSRGAIDRENKYAELANAIADGVYTCGDNQDRKTTSDIYNQMVDDLYPDNPNLLYLHKAYSKSLKRAIDGKQPDRVVVEVATPKESKREAITNFSEDGDSKRSKTILYLVIAVIGALLVAAIIVFAVIKPFSKPEEPETTVVASELMSEESTETVTEDPSAVSEDGEEAPADDGEETDNRDAETEEQAGDEAARTTEPQSETPDAADEATEATADGVDVVDTDDEL